MTVTPAKFEQKGIYEHSYLDNGVVGCFFLDM